LLHRPFALARWHQAKARLQFLAEHHGAGLLTGETGSGKSTAARTFAASLNPNLYKVLYLHWMPDPRWTCSVRWRWSWIWNRPLPRRSGAPDFLRHRAPQSAQKAAPHPDL
jgi:hypothetical protein